MRGRMAQIVIFSISCALVGKPHAGAQSAVANAAPEMNREGSCSASSASVDEQQSAPKISVAEVIFSSGIQLPTSDQDQIAASLRELTHGDSLDGVIDEALERVRAGWQNHGYFQAQVTGDARTLTSGPVNQRIAINVHVNEGLPAIPLGRDYVQAQQGD